MNGFEGVGAFKGALNPKPLKSGLGATSCRLRVCRMQSSLSCVQGLWVRDSGLFGFFIGSTLPRTPKVLSTLVQNLRHEDAKLAAFILCFNPHPELLFAEEPPRNSSSLSGEYRANYLHSFPLFFLGGGGGFLRNSS